jgi:hypothetical protein
MNKKDWLLLLFSNSFPVNLKPFLFWNWLLWTDGWGQLWSCLVVVVVVVVVVVLKGFPGKRNEVKAAINFDVSGETWMKKEVCE